MLIIRELFHFIDILSVVSMAQVLKWDSKYSQHEWRLCKWQVILAFCCDSVYLCVCQDCRRAIEAVRVNGLYVSDLESSLSVCASKSFCL